jgi:isoleucyl-tRNA synthetase
VRDVVSAALSVRKARGLRVRLPLASLTVAAPDAHLLAPFVDLIADEVNVRRVELTDDLAATGTFTLQAVPAACGPRLGAQTQHVIRAIKQGDWTHEGDTVVAGGIELLEGEYSLRLVPADPERSATLPGDRGVVVLDTEVTPELEREGVARDLVRVIQQARRAAALHVSDRVRLVVEARDADAVLDEVLREHGDMVRAETLTVDLQRGPAGEGAFEGTVGEAVTVRVGVERVR